MKAELQITFRVDASQDIGIGHLMRCLTLADELKCHGVNTAFICQNLPDNLVPLVAQKGHALCNLPATATGERRDWEQDAADTINCINASKVSVDWLVVDHYKIDGQWESRLSTHVKKIMVIDDLANRPHQCDLLLDQNFYSDQDTRYSGLTSPNCKKLLGPKYALLRPEFLHARAQLRERGGEIKRILVFLGGGDPDNLTTRAIEAIQALGRPDIATDVVVGVSNPHLGSIREFCNRIPNTTFLVQISNMAELISAADLAICAGGATTWERCFLGLPSITVVFADNQEPTTIDIAREGAILYLGWANKLTRSDYIDALRGMISNPGKLDEMRRNSLRLMGGSGYLGVAAIVRELL